MIAKFINDCGLPRFLACAKGDYRLAVNLAEVAEVRRVGRNSDERLVMLRGPSAILPARVDRVLSVLDPAPGDPLRLPACLDPAAGSFLGMVRFQGDYFLRVSPEYLATMREIDLAGVDGWLHREASTECSHAGLMAFTVPCSGTPRLPRIGLSRQQVLEVRKFSMPVNTPVRPGRLLGLAVWQDRMIPMLDLALALGYAPADITAASRIIVARGSSRNAVVAIPANSSMTQVEDIGSYRRAPVPRNANEAVLRGAFASGEGELLVPDIDAVL